MLHPAAPPLSAHSQADGAAGSLRPLRRRLMLAALGGAALLGSGCATLADRPLEAAEGVAPDAQALFDEACSAHGLAAWQRVQDLNIAYDGRWRALLPSLQPELVDARFRGRSQERILPRAGWVAQIHTGPGGEKRVLRRRAPAGRSMGTGMGMGAASAAAPSTGEVQVSYNGSASHERAVTDAAALVADGYLLFLLGPLALADRLAGGAGPFTMRRDGSEDVRGQACERLQLRLAPGLGFAPVDQLLLCIDRRERLVRRLRFSLEGLASTRGAVAEVDTLDYQRLHGIAWPTRFHERLRRPIPFLPVHDWELTGLDINRGWTEADLAMAPGGGGFLGLAAAPARALSAPAAGQPPVLPT